MRRPSKIVVFVQSNQETEEAINRLFSEALTSLYERRELHNLSEENLRKIYELSETPLLTEKGITDSKNFLQKEIPTSDIQRYFIGKTKDNLELFIEIKLLPKKSRFSEIFLRIL